MNSEAMQQATGDAIKRDRNDLGRLLAILDDVDGMAECLRKNIHGTWVDSARRVLRHLKTEVRHE